MTKRQFSIKWLFALMALVAIVAAFVGMLYQNFGPYVLLAAAIYASGFLFVAVLIFGRKMILQTRNFLEVWNELSLSDKQVSEALADSCKLPKPPKKHPLDE